MNTNLLLHVSNCCKCSFSQATYNLSWKIWSKSTFFKDVTWTVFSVSCYVFHTKVIIFFLQPAHSLKTPRVCTSLKQFLWLFSQENLCIQILCMKMSHRLRVLIRRYISEIFQNEFKKNLHFGLSFPCGIYFNNT